MRKNYLKANKKLKRHPRKPLKILEALRLFGDMAVGF